MEKLRKRFQGTRNIIRFNWHYYVIAFTSVMVLLVCTIYLSEKTTAYFYIISSLITFSIVISLSVSCYVYDLSGLYQFRWLDNLRVGLERKIININAGFDETSDLLKEKFKFLNLIVLDFYDPQKHTEISIKRARRLHPPYPGTKQIYTSNLTLDDKSIDTAIVMFSAHEIRNFDERVKFFEELRRVIKPDGEIVVTEHLRDVINFLAYNIGFFHFYSKSTWLKTFKSAGLTIHSETKYTPFITTFILKNHGVSY